MWMTRVQYLQLRKESGGPVLRDTPSYSSDPKPHEPPRSPFPSVHLPVALWPTAAERSCQESPPCVGFPTEGYIRLPVAWCLETLPQTDVDFHRGHGKSSVKEVKENHRMGGGELNSRGLWRYTRVPSRTELGLPTRHPDPH
ncbi:hypothetical protein BD309DRAFT_356446 [Dichomitus squalens]|nr:hypothetical protein BD309DRAFT_356446 [Dichomitus squalens]